MADHQENEWEWKGKQFKTVPGQFVTSLGSIVKKAGKGISIKMVRTSLTKFEKYGFLANKSADTGRLLTIINWESYQDREIKRAKKRAKAGHSKGKGRAPNNNVNNVNNIIKRYAFPLEYSEKLIKTFADFIINRGTLKKPVTEKAFTGLVNKLKKISNSEEESILILEESTINGWSGVFPLKNSTQKEGIKHNGFDKEYYEKGKSDGPEPNF
jgi:hypothetical protein